MNWLDRFCYRHSKYGIRNLMMIIIVGNAAAFVAGLVIGFDQVAYWLSFQFDLVLQGELWRLITFVFVPMNDNIIFIFFTLYLYFMYGRALEQEWGTLKFTIYYLTGMILTMVVGAFTGGFFDGTYINLSIFLAFATLNPDFQLLLFFVLPVKIKYLAWLTGAYYLFMVIFNPFPYNMMPLVALLNYVLFFFNVFVRNVKNFHRRSTKTVDFKASVRRAKAQKGYVHKCDKCGVTDTEAPDKEFRYCSLCTGYKCYCSDHIFDHEHH